MDALRFVCQACDKPLVTFQPGSADNDLACQSTSQLAATCTSQPGSPAPASQATPGETTLQRIEAKVDLLVARTVGTQREWYSIKQAADASGLSPTTIRRAIKSGALKAHNPSGSFQRPTYRIHRADLDTFMQKHAAGASVLPPPATFKRKIKSRYFGEM